MTEEQCQERRRRSEQTDRLGGHPTRFVSVHNGIDGEHERRRHGDRAANVELRSTGRDAVGWQYHETQDKDGDADREIDEKDPVPVERRKDASKQDAERSPTSGDKADHAHRFGAIGGRGEQVHDQRERHRRDDSSTYPLGRTCRDEQTLCGSHAAGERRQRKEHKPNQEEPTLSIEIPQPPTEQEKAAKGEQVGIHDPGERRLREPEINPDRRQRDVHDRRVKNDHQVAEAQHRQGEPALGFSAIDCFCC